MGAPMRFFSAFRAPSTTRGRRIALYAGASVLGLYVAFLILMNAVFLFGVIPELASNKDIGLRHGTAYSLWPGRVHVRDFYLRFQDSNVRMGLTVGEADVTIDVL